MKTTIDPITRTIIIFTDEEEFKSIFEKATALQMNMEDYVESLLKGESHD